MTFVAEKRIRFHHCDPAGVVFFPQYLVLCHEVIEDWIDSGVRIGFADLLRTRKLGTPTVSLHCEFLARSSFGESLSFELAVTRLGSSSITLSICARAGGELRLRCEQVLVLIDMPTFKAVPIPDDLRSKIAAFQLDGAPSG